MLALTRKDLALFSRAERTCMLHVPDFPANLASVHDSRLEADLASVSCLAAGRMC